MPAPTTPPIGLELANTAKRVTQAFDAALTASGGSSSLWLILLTIKTHAVTNQQDIADAVGIRGATLTYHLNAMEDAGLVTRRRDTSNRRVHVVELTRRGEEAFLTMRAAAARFDKRLRGNLSERDLSSLRRILGQLSRNVVEAG
jgi:MarR family transcriptional regulator for hemolysin